MRVCVMKNNLKRALIGIIVGIISGLFASGGGLLLVPVYTYILKLDEKEARATSLFCILPMVVLTAIIYNKNNYIDWSLGIKCAIGGIIGRNNWRKIIKQDFRQISSNSIYYISILCWF